MLPEPARGITAAIVTPFLNFRVAPGIANHLLLSGERMNAKRAYEVGLFYDSVAPGDLNARVGQTDKCHLDGGHGQHWQLPSLIFKTAFPSISNNNSYNPFKFPPLHGKRATPGKASPLLLKSGSQLGTRKAKAAAYLPIY